MEGEKRRVLVPYAHQVLPDYDDTLEPGYRFCPTDSELILYYLKRKIELGDHVPRCRMYDVNVYHHHPQELKERYRSCEDKWYFFTKREAKYPMGTRVNRRTKKFGHWKSTQKDKPVYDYVTKRDVGNKRSLAFHDDKNQKTPWLMQEYTYNDPNLPNRSHANKLTDWVLCKMYKKESTHDIIRHMNKFTTQGIMMNLHPQKEEDINRVKLIDHQLGANVEMMYAHPIPITMQPPDAFNYPNQGLAPEQVHYENQSNMSTSTKGFRFSSSASSSSSVCPGLDGPVGDAPEDSQTLVNMQNGYNRSMDATNDDIFEDIMSLLDADDDEGVHRDFTPFDEFMRSAQNTYHEDSQTLVNMQNCYNRSMDASNDDDIYEEIMSLLDDDEEDVQTDFTPFDEFNSTYHVDSQTQVNMQRGCNRSMDAATGDDGMYEEIMSLLGDDEEDVQTN